MPSELSQDIVQFLVYMLPGFLAAWVFYGLTSHAKPTQFERVVQALIFTFIIQIFVPPFRWALEAVGEFIPLRPWDQAAAGLSSFVLAILFGVLVAFCANKDSVHGWLRKRGFTTRTSHPSEWYYVLSEKVTYVVLHLRDGRRLYGWPKEWPIESNAGQFYIMQPSWLDEGGKQIDLPQLDGVLISAQDVRWIEFLRKSDSSHEPSASAENADPRRFQSAASVGDETQQQRESAAPTDAIQAAAAAESAQRTAAN